MASVGGVLIFIVRPLNPAILLISGWNECWKFQPGFLIKRKRIIIKPMYTMHTVYVGLS